MAPLGVEAGEGGLRFVELLGHILELCGQLRGLRHQRCVVCGGGVQRRREMGDLALQGRDGSYFVPQLRYFRRICAVELQCLLERRLQRIFISIDVIIFFLKYAMIKRMHHNVPRPGRCLVCWQVRRRGSPAGLRSAPGAHHPSAIHFIIVLVIIIIIIIIIITIIIIIVVVVIYRVGGNCE